MEDKNRQLHLVKHGVYCGYSEESIIDFIAEFDMCLLMDEAWRQNRFLERAIHDKKGEPTGHIIAKSEIDIPQKEIIKLIGIRRFCDLPFPEEYPLDIRQQKVDNLYENDHRFITAVNIIMERIDNNE